MLAVLFCFGLAGRPSPSARTQLRLGHGTHEGRHCVSGYLHVSASPSICIQMIRHTRVEKTVRISIMTIACILNLTIIIGHHSNHSNHAFSLFWAHYALCLDYLSFRFGHLVSPLSYLVWISVRPTMFIWFPYKTSYLFCRLYNNLSRPGARTAAGLSC
jgi:hypothetical protein